MLERIGIIAAAAGVVLTAIGVLLALLSLRAARLQRRRQFETIYVQRYWAIMDGLTVDGLAGRRMDELAPENEKAALAYIRLCEDEIELRRAGWISSETWSLWAAGITGQLENRWPFDLVWEQVRCENENRPQPVREYTELLAYMESARDPYLELPVARRIWNAVTPSP